MAPLAFRFVARFFIVFLVLLSPLFSSAPAATAEALDDVFEVKQGQAAGGCDQRRAELSSTQLPESRALVGAALAAIRDYKTSCAARDQLTAFFGVAFQAAQASYAPVNATHFERVENVYNQLKNFFDGKAPPPGGRPRLFCSSDWLAPKAWTDQALDNTGKPLFRPDSSNNVPVLIRDLPEARSRVATPGIVPFWAADYHKYFFFSAVNSTCGPSVTAGRLNGFAISRIRPRSVTLCARAFDSRDRVDALAAVVAVREGQLLDRSKVQSMTLLHEGVHVVLPPGGSPDTAYGTTNVLRLVTSGRLQDALKNPDTYTHFALAAYLSQKDFPATAINGSSGGGGRPQRWQFHTGRATLQKQQRQVT